MDSLDGVFDGQYSYSWAGEYTKIYILDTGIQAGHPEFTGRVLDGKSYVGGPSTVDNDSHGTFVASAAAGLHGGAAKSAAIISVRIADRSDPSTSTLIDAINWTTRDIRCAPPDRSSTGCIGNLGSYIPIVNISFLPSRNKMLESAVTGLINAGATVFASAGNYGDNACAYALANVPGVIVVGAVQRSGGGVALWPSSSSGGCVTLFAPGAAVGAAYPTSQYNCNPGWSGTSLSSPVAAGVGAVFADIFGGDLKRHMLDYARYGMIQGDLRGGPNVLLQQPPPTIGCYYIDPQPPPADR
jgi:hypothetical protein